MTPTNIIIHPPVYNALASYGILIIAVLMAMISIYVYARGHMLRMIVFICGMGFIMGVSALVAIGGILTRFDMVPPPMFIMIVAVLGLSLAVGLTPLGRILSMDTSLVALVALQIFRFPLELIMHHAFDAGIMPIQLSYSGYNYDIVTGIGALILTVLMLRGNTSKGLVWLWNIWGMYCLIAILIIAISTSPVVQAFGSEPQNLNTWVLFFPYVWLPVVLVTIAISGHIIITRKLLQK